MLPLTLFILIILPTEYVFFLPEQASFVALVLILPNCERGSKENPRLGFYQSLWMNYFRNTEEKARISHYQYSC